MSSTTPGVGEYSPVDEQESPPLILAAGSERLVLRAARLFDGVDHSIMDGARVVIEHGRVTDVVHGGSLSDGADAGRVIDLGDVTLMPGMVDLHTHLTAWANAWRSPLDPATRYGIQAAANLATALRAGVTTIRDVGTFEDVSIAAREAVSAGVLPGPRILACRRAVSITGALSPMLRTEHLGLPHRWMSQANGPSGLRGAVRGEIEGGADWIKLYYGFGDWTVDEITAAVDEAHSLGARVACHANRPNAIKAAIAAGVDSIEHGMAVDGDDLQAMAERGIAWVPTLFVVDELHRQAESTDNPAYGSLTRRREHHQQKFSEALSLDLRIGTGVDSLPDEGGVAFAAVAEEVTLMVSLGMARVRALRAATSVAAEILGLEDQIGILKPGMTADIVAVRGNPLEDSRDLRRVAFVLCGPPLAAKDHFA